jgi:hypothetical protein
MRGPSAFLAFSNRIRPPNLNINTLGGADNVVVKSLAGTAVLVKEKIQ